MARGEMTQLVVHRRCHLQWLKAVQHKDTSHPGSLVVPEAGSVPGSQKVADRPRVPGVVYDPDPDLDVQIDRQRISVLLWPEALPLESQKLDLFNKSWERAEPPTSGSPQVVG